MTRKTTAQKELEQRAERTAHRIANIGVPKQELATLAGVDRGTIARALKADERISDRTWVKLERALTNLEDEIGIGVQVAGSTTASGESIVESTIEYRGARITLSGRADAVAESIRQFLDEK